MALDPVLAEMMKQLAASDIPAFADCSPARAREVQLARRASRASLPRLPVGSVEDLVLPGPHGDIPAWLYRPTTTPRGILVYCHGGGWVVGDLDGVDPLARVLVDSSGLALLSVEYRLAPEHPFPAPLDDVYAAVEWAAGRFALPLLVGGDSAGANLATAAAMRARDGAGPRISGQILFYPVTDHDFDTASYRENGLQGYAITTRDMRWFWDQYADARQRELALASPLRASSLTGMPPAFVVVAGYDPLRDEGIAYARRMAAAGVPVRLREYETMIHGFASMIGAVVLAEEAVREAGAWAAAMTAVAPVQRGSGIRSHTSQRRPSS